MTKDEARIICEHLADDDSKEIFGNRLSHSLTGDYEYIHAIVRNIKNSGGVECIYHRLCNGIPKVMFGAGIWASIIHRTYSSKMNLVCFIDNKSAGGQCMGYPIVSLDEFLKRDNGEEIIISSRLYHEEIREQILASGISEQRIINAGAATDRLSCIQYFDLPALCEHAEENEIFVDAGAFDGRTTQMFMQWCSGSYRKIYVFEPDPSNLDICRGNLKGLDREKVVYSSKGLWDRNATVAFNSLGKGSSSVQKDGRMQVEVTKLDSICQSDRVTFIKMDLEGAECPALMGSRNTIISCRPKLAISVYHKPEDIWEIPKMILDMNPNYTFYLRHYSIAAPETVLYAIDG